MRIADIAKASFSPAARADSGTASRAARPLPVLAGNLAIGRVVIRRACSCGGRCARCQDEEAQKRMLLQRAVGGVAARPVASPYSTQEGQRAHRLRAKLVVGSPGDAYEQEADRIADQMTREDAHLAPPVSGALLPRVSRIQRQSLVSPSEDEGTVLRILRAMKKTPGSNHASLQAAGRVGRFDGPSSGLSLDWESRLARSKHGGQRLPRDLLHDMEARFQVNFDAVRVHSDSEAAGLSTGIHARAFTHGAHIYFGAGEYAPKTTEGRRVLAHELTHVVQQGADGPGAADPRTMQRLSRPKRITAGLYTPWGSGDPVGAKVIVSTSVGTDVPAWVPYSRVPVDQRFWCHGHSLGTYVAFGHLGYSVFSGPPMKDVLNDEWKAVSDSSTRTGDITVAVGTLDHSARFTKVAFSKGAIDEKASTLSTKNGQQPLKEDSFAGIKATYPGRTWQTFRK